MINILRGINAFRIEYSSINFNNTSYANTILSTNGTKLVISNNFDPNVTDIEIEYVDIALPISSNLTELILILQGYINEGLGYTTIITESNNQFPETDRLQNIAGSLFFNGSALGGGSGGSDIDGILTGLRSSLGNISGTYNQLTYTSGTYQINSIVYTKTGAAITLANGHATLDRIDIVYLTNLSTAIYLQGTASTSPVTPVLPANTILLAAIGVSALASSTINGYTLSVVNTGKNNTVNAVNPGGLFNVLFWNGLQYIPSINLRTSGTYSSIGPFGNNLPGFINGSTLGPESLALSGRMLFQDTTTPGITTNKLWANGGNLYWNNIQLNNTGSLAPGTVNGNTLYWNGSAWVETSVISVNPVGNTIYFAVNQNINFTLLNGSLLTQFDLTPTATIFSTENSLFSNYFNNSANISTHTLTDLTNGDIFYSTLVPNTFIMNLTLGASAGSTIFQANGSGCTTIVTDGSGNQNTITQTGLLYNIFSQNFQFTTNNNAIDFNDTVLSLNISDPGVSSNITSIFPNQTSNVITDIASGDVTEIVIQNANAYFDYLATSGQYHYQSGLLNTGAIMIAADTISNLESTILVAPDGSITINSNDGINSSTIITDIIGQNTTLIYTNNITQTQITLSPEIINISGGRVDTVKLVTGLAGGTYILLNNDFKVALNDVIGGTFQLPASPVDGQTYEFSNINVGPLVIDPNGSSIFAISSTLSTFDTLRLSFITAKPGWISF